MSGLIRTGRDLYQSSDFRDGWPTERAARHCSRGAFPGCSWPRTRHPPGRDLGPGAESKPDADALNVPFGGALVDAQSLSNFPVRQSLGDEGRHLALPPGQGGCRRPVARSMLMPSCRCTVRPVDRSSCAANGRYLVRYRHDGLSCWHSLPSANESWHLPAGAPLLRPRTPAGAALGADAIDPVAIAPRWLNWRHPPLVWDDETF